MFAVLAMNSDKVVSKILLHVYIYSTTYFPISYAITV